ncbi:hypothetical protein GJ744_000223 [Endocarpon pusillum]|uniref:Uncharacterized protein n=1 Tax=Endocarpon pusillum TaxID=364733 RepID=A0A8H7EAN2_9EURO|nr:hypothetical protein GJ744_000223 [Endocarpon pusillum]
MQKMKKPYMPSGVMSAKGGDWQSIHCDSFLLPVGQYKDILAKTYVATNRGNAAGRRPSGIWAREAGPEAGPIEGVAGYENEQKSDIRQQPISMKARAGGGFQDDQS